MKQFLKIQSIDLLFVMKFFRDALENPAKARIQEEMNKINVERFIKKNIPTFEKMSKKDAVNLSDFKF